MPELGRSPNDLLRDERKLLALRPRRIDNALE